MSRQSPTETAAQWGPVLLRLALAIPMIVSGAGKVLAVGPKSMGISSFAGFLASLGVPLPAVAAWGVGLVELVGGFLLLVGLFVRITGSLIAIIMFVAMVAVHLPNGYPSSSGGIEYTLTLVLLALAVVLSGPGALSLERALFDEEVLTSGTGRSMRAD
ncbi:DoxX family protein [Haloferax mediterranei ATCC 33500]|uniref:DoxX family protein n=2 Tax=Haloferax mediterranei (strain ATCC 33500 / DSM 1411 / JCM 8866 / NBRC 14739 / NCIMB 2177 / R-4) TaxID=523841 RepID=A0A4P8P4G9_HALMT|nr:DoxX family protein [Haloferax mediterranei]MDX5987911.1 DoxX family protein [Haloferax mediterranei ATCC 33500]QCQ74384.1 DoxX family protein [Haloferax mediterranei ATCC 33500]